jgi:hypothetical protein
MNCDVIGLVLYLHQRYVGSNIHIDVGLDIGRLIRTDFLAQVTRHAGIIDQCQAPHFPNLYNTMSAYFERYSPPSLI